MNDYWHIPRASLSSSSAASIASSSNQSHRSHSNALAAAQQQRDALQRQLHSRPHIKNYSQQKSGIEGGGVGSSNSDNSHSNNNGITLSTYEGSRQAHAGHAKRTTNTRRSNIELNATNPATTAAAAAAVLAAAATAKRGSRSSQGSSESNHSTRSAASGSLLLTAANLERFAEIHKKQRQRQRQQQQLQNKLYVENLPTVHSSSNNNTSNLTHSLQQQQQPPQHSSNNIATSSPPTNSNDAIIAMDPNLDFIKAKDLDTVSIASSMHFTMVNGEGGSKKKPKRGLCDRGRQVTVLIVSMSMIFLLLIMGMIYAMEMRAREMPQS